MIAIAAGIGLCAVGLFAICMTAYSLRHSTPPDSLDTYLRELEAGDK